MGMFFFGGRAYDRVDKADNYAFRKALDQYSLKFY